MAAAKCRRNDEMALWLMKASMWHQRKYEEMKLSENRRRKAQPVMRKKASTMAEAAMKKKPVIESVSESIAMASK
jgi:hypothetical protein